jgi:hypothetical protein
VVFVTHRRVITISATDGRMVSMELRHEMDIICVNVAHGSPIEGRSAINL